MTKAAEKKGPGRPPTYKAIFAKQAARACKLGAIDTDLAEIFGVTDRTIRLWKEQHAEFAAALAPAKAEANEKVVRSLYERATGYEHPAVKIFLHEGKPVVVDYVERYPPDTGAAAFFLKNRDPENWKDRQEVGGKGGGPIEVVVRIAKEGRRVTAS